MTITAIGLDADDTLWHNESMFHMTQQEFLDLLKDHGDAAEMTARLRAVERRNHKLYGYGAKSFTLSMIETATELCGDSLNRDTVAAMLAAGRDLLSHPVELLDGVGETIEALADRVRLVLVTKGDLLHQEAKLAASGLGELFHGVEIVSDKTPDTFVRLFTRYGVAPDRAGMAGDSIRSDIAPVLAAGGWAAFLPPELSWSHERAAVPSEHPRFTQLDRFAELPGWLDRIG